MTQVHGLITIDTNNQNAIDELKTHHIHIDDNTPIEVSIKLALMKIYESVIIKSIANNTAEISVMSHTNIDYNRDVRFINTIKPIITKAHIVYHISNTSKREINF